MFNWNKNKLNNDKNKTKLNKLEIKLKKLKKEEAHRKMDYLQNRSNFWEVWKPRIGMPNKKDAYEKAMQKTNDCQKQINEINWQEQTTTSKNKTNSPKIKKNKKIAFDF